MKAASSKDLAVEKDPAASRRIKPAWRTGTSRWILAGLITAVVFLFFIFATDDWFSIVNYTLIAAIAALGLNVL